MRSLDESHSVSSTVNTAYRPFDSPAWAQFVDMNGDQVPLADRAFKADFLRYADLDSSGVYYYQFTVFEEMIRRIVNARELFEEAVPYCLSLQNCWRRFVSCHDAGY